MNEYYCTVDYQTEGGDAGSAGYYIEADDIDKASEIARQRALNDRRRRVRKVYGGSAQLID